MAKEVILVLYQQNLYWQKRHKLIRRQVRSISQNAIMTPSPTKLSITPQTLCVAAYS